jgi:hypothetical protein
MTQMMRVNSEALRAVAESQADWVKSIVSTRGFFRNGSPPPMPLETQRYDEEDDEDDDEPAQSKTIYDVLAPLAEHWAPSVKPLMSMLASGAGVKAITSGSVTPKVGEVDLSSKPNWEFREFIDLNYAAAKAKAKKEAKHAASTKPSLQARVMADPELMAHFLGIKSLLDPGEAAQILALGERIGEDQQEWLIAKISALSPAEAAALLRTTLAELTDAHASTESPK